MAVLHTFFDILRFGGTLVRRGTPVEKHWPKELSNTLKNSKDTKISKSVSALVC
jgi:hypothetical protein